MTQPPTQWWQDHDAEVIAKFIDRITSGAHRLPVIHTREVHDIAINEFGVQPERLAGKGNSNTFTITVNASNPDNREPDMGGLGSSAMGLRQRMDEGRRS